MQILHNVPLALHSTMRLGGKASYFVEVRTRQEIIDAVDWADQHHLTPMMIGDGSNIVWRDEGFPGLLISNKIPGYELKTESDGYHLTAGAGENWDSVVERTVEAGASGVECLSLIPGTTGATPVQNVGAYGQEIAQTLISIDAYDVQSHQFVTLSAKDCNFGYRTSRFKTNDRSRFFITSITLQLRKDHVEPPFYRSLQTYVDEHKITDYSPQSLRQAVIDIRSSKLPDPSRIANNGSFFANPIITTEQLTHLQADYPNISHWPYKDDHVKISAAWLLDQAGFTNCHDQETGMSTWPSQTLVLVNEHARTTADLLKFKQKIIDAVHAKFDILLEQEPELLP